MPDNSTANFQATQENLLQRLVSQNEQTMALRVQELAQKQAELDQQAEFIKVTLAKAESEAASAAELRRSNEINQKQIEVIERLLGEVEEWVEYFKSGKAEKAFNLVQVKLDNLAHVVEAMILNRPADETTSMLLGLIRGEISPPSSRSRGKTGPLRTRSNSMLGKHVDEAALVEALLQCNVVQRDFDTIKADMPLEVSNRVVGNNRKVQVAELVRAAMQFGKLRELIETVRNYENDSFAMRDVDRLVNL